jgi:hypothetical protein
MLREAMGFNEEELLKIKKATSGLFKKKARRAIAQSLLAMKPRIEAARKLDGAEDEEALKILVNEATDARHLALQLGANSHGHPQWAAAAACESWLHELVSGTPESIIRIEEIIAHLSNRG